jgi:carboxyl-terminal processing protease
LVLLAVAACTATTDPTRPAASDFTTRLFTRAYDQITDLYIEPLPASVLAPAGLQHLSAIDSSFGLSRNGSIVTVAKDGVTLRRIDAPADTDNQGWAQVTSQVLTIARTNFDKLGDLSDDRLQESVFDGIVTKLDRFSRYAGAESAREQRASRDGFGGIGVTLDYQDEQVRIQSIVPSGPADQAGLKVNDRIAEVDGETVANLAQRDVIRRLRGPVDSKVMLTVQRAGASSLLKMPIQRALIVLPTVTVRRESGLAIFKVTSFNHQTAQSLSDELSRVRRDMGTGLRGIVLDLRGNPGGLLDQAVTVADLFLGTGPIISTRGRHPASVQYFTASHGDATGGLPIAVLINGGSASASEIVAAALQDRGRAVVIGSSSFGKGTVQTVLRMPNDGELTLTWARLHTPSGYLLHMHGVVPSVCTSDVKDDDQGVGFAIEHGIRPGLRLVSQPRATMDDQTWADLRKNCPAQVNERDFDVKVARRLLSDGKLYSEALTLLSPSVAAHLTPASAENVTR